MGCDESAFGVILLYESHYASSPLLGWVARVLQNRRWLRRRSVMEICSLAAVTPELNRAARSSENKPES